MAFVPSAKDFESSEQGFVPTAEHFENNEKQQPESILQRLKQVPGNLLKSVEHEAINTANPFISLGNIISEKVHNILPESLANPNYSKMENIPEPEGYEQIKNSPEAWAAFGLPLASGAYGLGKLGFRGLSSAGAKLSPAIAKFTGKEATEKSGNIFKDLVGENNLSNYHEPIVKKIRNIFGKDIEEVQGKFNAIGDKASERGIGEVDKDTLDSLRRLKLKNESALKERVKNFKENPSYKEAHELQSELGKIGAKKLKSIDTSEEELGKKLLQIRTELRSDILENFERHNAGDLAQEYKDATQDWKNRVKIYDKNKTIRDIVHKTGIEEINPTNIDKVLTEDSAATRYVLSKLSQEEKDLILANRLKAANENPKKMVEKFNQLRNSRYAKLITPEHENAFTDLEKSVEFANKFGKTALKGAAKTGGGILALLGLDKAGRYTGIL